MLSRMMLDVPVGAVGAQSAGLEPFDLPDFPHDVALDPAALAALVHIPEGAVGPAQSPGSQETDDREKEDACG